ncbi:MAG: hypothetical protein ACFFAV_05100 [Candidatus Hermodarchaeota archaeon]
MISNQLFIEFKSDLLKIKDRKKLEKAYYEKLSKCLKAGQFKAFELLIDASIDFNIFIEINKLHNRFEIISKLLRNCVDKISTGYQTSALGEIIDILRLSNKYNLVHKEIKDSERIFLKQFKEKNKLFLENLNDLFNKPSDSFILFVCTNIPQDFYNYFIESSIFDFPDLDGLMDYIKNSFFNQYTVYGLNIRNLSSIKKFFLDLNKYLSDNSTKENEFIEINLLYNYQLFYYGIEEEHKQLVEKVHLVSPKNVLENMSEILDKNNYNFYNLSMVLIGGLGPQGLGFTYSTPRGEVIEICSDQSESEAIIIKYKQYLKNKFLIKLEKELTNYGIDNRLKNNILDFLSDVLNQKEIIHYYKKETIIKKIKEFLEELEVFKLDLRSKLQDIINKISAAVTIILRRIELRDQYVTRMNLAAEGKIKPEDIAKLTSLKGKSHYDVLRERFFFQHIVDWFYELYNTKKLINEK